MSLSVSVKNSIFLISEKIIVLSFAFLNSVLLARLAGPEIFGQYSYIIAYASLFVPLAVMGLNNIAAKYFVKYPKNSHYYFLIALSLRTGGAVISIFLGVFIAFNLNMNSDELTLIITLLLLQSFTALYIVEYYYLANNRVIYTLTIRLAVLLFTAIAKLVIILNGANLFYLVLMHGSEFLFIGLGYIILYYHQGHQKKQKRTITPHSLIAFFHKGKWLFLSGLAAVLYLKIDQIMLANIHNVEQVAFYAAASKLSEFWYIFPILIANAFNAQLIQLKQKNKLEYQLFILKILNIMVVIAVIISLVTVLLSQYIIELIYGQQYQQSAAILNVHIFATIFIFQRAILSKWLIIEGHYRFSLLSHGAGAISNIGLNLIFIPQFGGLGAAWATLISYMIASFLSLAFSKQTRPFMKIMSQAMLKWPFFLIRSITQFNQNKV